MFLSLKIKSTTLFIKFLTKFNRIDEILRKIPENMNKN